MDHPPSARVGPYDFDGYMGDMMTYKHRHAPMSVIRTVEVYEGKEWLHASISHKRRMPTYDELKELKALFIGDDLAAYQVFPKVEEHINMHEYCLHLFAPVGHNPVPDLSERV